MITKVGNINVENTIFSVETREILISEDSLYRILNPCVENLKKSKEWWSPFGCAVTIFIALLTTDFKQYERFPNFESYANLFFWALGIFCLCYSIYAFANWKKKNTSAEDIISSIMSSSVCIDDDGHRKRYNSKKTKIKTKIQTN